MTFIDSSAESPGMKKIHAASQIFFRKQCIFGLDLMVRGHSHHSVNHYCRIAMIFYSVQELLFEVLIYAIVFKLFFW
jgi:hypothetical protein